MIEIIGFEENCLFLEFADVKTNKSGFWKSQSTS
jgi:hypothetical protein